MSRFVKAQLGLGHSVIYADDSGKFYRFSGGTWAWRNHNPGNLVPGKVSKRNNQIGTTGTFAIFPDYETGHGALIDCLQTTYENATIDDLVTAYAPETDGNNVKKYTKFLRDKTGITDDKKVKDFSLEEFDNLWHAIEQMEGYKKGKIVEVFPIIEIHKDNKGIYGYHVKKNGWVTKQECMALVKKGKLDLVVCTSRLGHDYLRARAGSIVNGSLNHMVVKDPKKDK
jgi:hypothetical protein